MKRKTFLQTLTGSAAALAAGTAGWVVVQGSVRIRPLHPEKCGASFLAFCERARFASAEEAVQITARRGHAFELFLDKDKDLSAVEVIPLQENKKHVEGPVAPLAQPRPDGRALDKVKTVSNRNRRLRSEHALAKLSMNHRRTGDWGRPLAQSLDCSLSV